jgi:hypothetical protein
VICNILPCTAATLPLPNQNLYLESTVYYYWYIFKELRKFYFSEQNGQCLLLLKNVWIWRFSTNTKHDCVPCHNSKCCVLQDKGILGIENKDVRTNAALYSANIHGDHVLYILSPPSPEEYQLSFKQNV